MAKQIITGKKCREKILSGVKQLAEVVCITLGPKGRNVGLDKKWIEPRVIHDGVTVAKEIELPNPFENFGAQLVRQAAGKTADRAGDGTTTSTLLAWKMIEAGIKEVNNGANPMTIKDGMEIARDFLLKRIKELSKEVKDKSEIEQIATVASASPELGKMIAEALNKVGKEGVITVDVSERIDTQVEYKEGMEFDKGYMSPYFSTDTEKMTAELENPHILITDQVVLSASDIAVFLENFVKTTNRKEIVIISPSVEGAALSTLVTNKLRGGILPLAVYAPAFAERRKEVLEDIAVLTGGTVISKEVNMKIEEVTIAQLGKADRVWCNADKTKIIGGMGSSEKITARANQIRDLIAKSDSDFEKSKLKERLARLISGVAIIKVGATTELELNDKKERVIDAVEATKSALEEGVIAGGGVILWRLSKEMESLKNEDKDIQKGINIVQQSIISPITLLIENAGKDPDMILTILEIDKDYNTGFNVMNQEVIDLIKAGIIDPTKVVREALINAISVSSLILTTEAIVTELPENKKEKTAIDQ